LVEHATPDNIREITIYLLSKKGKTSDKAVLSEEVEKREEPLDSTCPYSLLRPYSLLLHPKGRLNAAGNPCLATLPCGSCAHKRELITVKACNPGRQPSRRIPDIYSHEVHCDRRPQHFLYFFPLPQGQGSFRPTFGPVKGAGTGDVVDFEEACAAFESCNGEDSFHRPQYEML